MNYNTGMNYPFKIIKDATPEEILQIAEGCKELFDLLTYCFNNGIETVSCCAGGRYAPYITFVITEKTLPFINQLLEDFKSTKVLFSFEDFDLEKNDLCIYYSEYTGVELIEICDYTSEVLEKEP